MLAAIFLASQWHFLANKHAVLVGCSAFWPVNCIFLHKKTRTRCTAEWPFCYWSLFCDFRRAWICLVERWVRSENRTHDLRGERRLLWRLSNRSPYKCARTSVVDIDNLDQDSSRGISHTIWTKLRMFRRLHWLILQYIHCMCIIFSLFNETRTQQWFVHHMQFSQFWFDFWRRSPP
jgi:hypothetical protein